MVVTLGFCRLHKGLRWTRIIGAGFLGGIGFTMSIFIVLLTFEDSTVVDNSKIAILLTSLISGITGFIVLKQVLKNV
jgi:Na+:H+ antiporter, NhaA family